MSSGLRREEGRMVAVHVEEVPTLVVRAMQAHGTALCAIIIQGTMLGLTLWRKIWG